MFDGNKQCIAAEDDKKDEFQNFRKKIVGDYSSWGFEDMRWEFEDMSNGMPISNLVYKQTSDYIVYVDDFEISYPYLTVCKKILVF